jgi:hypothetical protein
MRDWIGDLIGAACLFALIPLMLIIGHAMGF